MPYSSVHYSTCTDTTVCLILPLQVWGQKCSEAVCAAMHPWIKQLTLGGPERANMLRALSRSTSMHRPPAVSWVGKNNSSVTASITLHTRCLFSGTLLYLPLLNWEWMTPHRGVENNGWGTVGNIVCETPWTLVFTRETKQAHSIMWQSKTKQSMLLYGRQLNQQPTVLSSF